jgi:hypothetical protein
MLTVRVVAVGVLVAVGCGRLRPLDAGSEPALPDASTPPDVAAPPDAGPSEAVFVLRLVNVSEKTLDLPLSAYDCGFDLSVRRADSGEIHRVSAVAWGTWCDCASCSYPLRCSFNDFLCDQTRPLAPGQHLDLDWDGLIATRAAPTNPACSATCDAWEMVRPGAYLFHFMAGNSDVSEIEALLPAPTGVIEIPIRR